MGPLKKKHIVCTSLETSLQKRTSSAAASHRVTQTFDLESCNQIRVLDKVSKIHSNYTDFSQRSTKKKIILTLASSPYITNLCSFPHGYMIAVQNEIGYFWPFLLILNLLNLATMIKIITKPSLKSKSIYSQAASFQLALSHTQQLEAFGGFVETMENWSAM